MDQGKYSASPIKWNHNVAKQFSSFFYYFLFFVFFYDSKWKALPNFPDFWAQIDAAL